jgi:hypothetical protein
VKAAPSSAHWKLEPVSVEVKLKLALVLVLGFAGEALIDVSGAVVSTLTVHECEAGVASTLPAASRARTWNVCGPFARPLYVCGLVHAVNAAPSSEHSNVAPASLVKVKLAELEVLVAPGPVPIVVSGATVSTVQV